MPTCCDIYHTSGIGTGLWLALGVICQKSPGLAHVLLYVKVCHCNPVALVQLVLDFHENGSLGRESTIMLLAAQ